MNEDKLQQLRIAAEHKRRSTGPLWLIVVGAVLLTATAVYFAVPRAADSIRTGGKSGAASATTGAATNAARPASSGTPAPLPDPASQAGRVQGSVLTVSGYLVARERIELSPRFMGVVKWIGVSKGDAVTNGQVVVLLDDAEYKARIRETQGRLAGAKVAVARAELELKRTSQLVATRIETEKALDDARLQLEATQATVQEIEGQLDLLETYLAWTVIRSPIDGVVLEKLVDPNELVTPQSFGGTRGPSTALIALADPKDLQVEIDLNESDLSKIRLKQKCQVSPEAYPDRRYDGYVAEIAPEASRQKGTLQIKVQVVAPDRYLTPELSARVDFLP